MHEQLADLPINLTGHLQLTLMALAIGVTCSVPLGVWVTRKPRWQGPVIGVAGVIQTIPTLALLAVMVPLLAMMGQYTSALFGFALPGFGYTPALIAITLYSVLPILQNTVAAIHAVDPVLIQAAKSVGMTPMQQLMRVELPLAMPVIVAGIRTATVWVVGMATIATPVGARSLGNYIFSGLQTRNTVSIVFGCVAAALLALLLDGLVHAIQTGIRQGRKYLLSVALVGVALLYVYAVGTLLTATLQPEAHPRVRIGAKPFTEQLVLSEIMRKKLSRDAGCDTQIFSSLGSTVVFDALRQGHIDAYVDYMGTLWTTALGHKEPLHSEPLRQALVDELYKRHGILVLGALGFENAYTFAMRQTHAKALGIETLSDLSRLAPQFILGSDYEFLSRHEWHSVRLNYAMQFRDMRSMDPSLMYEAIKHEQLDVISAYTTDGRIQAFGLQSLRDDKHAIPPYDAVILVNAKFAKQQPRAINALRTLLGRLDTLTMQTLNLAVDVDGKSPRQAVLELFETKSLF